MLVLLAGAVCFPCHAVKAGHGEQGRMAIVIQSLGAEPCYGVFAAQMWGW